MLALVVALACIGAVLSLTAFNRWRFVQRTDDEIRALLALASRGHVSEDALPLAVARYRDLAVGNHGPVTTLRMRHGGTFCTSPHRKPFAIRGTQVFTADPPGFVWSARIRRAPGVWIDARDEMIDGVGSMRVMLDDTVELIDAHGPQIDQGAALRLLAEMVWYPTVLFDSRYVSWSQIGATRALATLHVGHVGPAVSAIFEFGPDDLPVAISGQRYDGRGALRAWGGTYRDWRVVAGLRIPFEVEVQWQLESGPFTYAHWLLEDVEYDVDLPGESGPIDTGLQLPEPA